MSATLERIEREALELPPHERARLVDKLWESLGETTVSVLTEPWQEEIDRRSRQMDEGRVHLVPGEQVMREARESARRRQ